MRANPRQMTSPVTTEPACSKPKITDIGNLPHIPQDTLILDEFVKPPGSVWWGERQKLQLHRLQNGLDCCAHGQAQGLLPFSCMSGSQWYRVKAERMQSGTMRDSFLSMGIKSAAAAR